MSQIVMPQAGQSMEEGTIVRWHKAEGDSVAKGEILFEIETDKSVIEVEASESGVLGRILVPAGKTVAVKTPVAEMNAECGMRNAESTNAECGMRNAESAIVIPVLMPKAGQSMEEGTLVKWRVAPGAMIRKGDVIFEVETDKSVVEVEATDEGRLARIVAAEGAVVPVLQPVAFIGESDGDVAAYLAAGGGGVKREAEAVEAVKAAGEKKAIENKRGSEQEQANEHEKNELKLALQTPQGGPGRVNGGRVKASPAARKMARERGIDLAAVATGSGPGGRILSSDVAQANVNAECGMRDEGRGARGEGRETTTLKPYAPVTPKSGQSVRTKMSPMRKAIARNLLASKQNIPHWYLQRVIDADPMLAFYRAQKAKYPCSVNDVIVLAVSRAIMEFPEFRCRVDGDDIVELPTVNIGIAVGLEAGLVVPVALGVERMTLQQLGAESKRLAEAARTTGKVENMGKGVFTISNLGMFGVDQFTAIINPPEAAILAVSAAREEVIVKNGMMRPGRTMNLTLSADHRLIDGVLGARFMARLKEMLENPEFFLI